MFNFLSVCFFSSLFVGQIVNTKWILYVLYMSVCGTCVGVSVCFCVRLCILLHLVRALIIIFLKQFGWLCLFCCWRKTNSLQNHIRFRVVTFFGFVFLNCKLYCAHWWICGRCLHFILSNVYVFDFCQCKSHTIHLRHPTYSLVLLLVFSHFFRYTIKCCFSTLQRVHIYSHAKIACPLSRQCFSIVSKCISVMK